MTSDEIASKFDLFCERLRVQRHIVAALNKKGNAKQATESAQFFLTSTKTEIVSDLEKWFRSNPYFSRLDSTEQDRLLLLELTIRINGELARLNVPVYDWKV